MKHIKEKKVELIELFYDLIYVYAISRMTMLIEEPTGGTIPLSGFFRYLIVSFVILQVWLYLTNYINRYGQWEWWEFGITCVNMTATVYMTNTISLDWGGMAATFNLSMLVMLLCVAAMYFIQTVRQKQDTGAAKNSLLILTVDCTLYLCTFIVSLTSAGQAVLWLDVAAVLVGAFLPFFIRGNFDKSIINFPHLAERFELITIITFGEAIVGMTEYFDVHHFSLKPILVFAVLLGLFGGYVVQIHYLMEHERSERALRLMFGHYFVVISLNLLTVALKLIHSTEMNSVALAVMIAASLTVFYLSIMANSSYYKDSVSFTGADVLKMVVPAACGFGVIFLLKRSVYGVLIETLIVSAGEFVIPIIK